MIYKLVCTDGHYYIGSTTQKLNIIFNRYKYLSKTRTDRVYEHINILGWDKVNIELIEKYPCNNKKELNKKEENYIDYTDFLCLNNEVDEVESEEVEVEEVEVEEVESESEVEELEESESEESEESDLELEESDLESDIESEENKYNNGKIYKLMVMIEFGIVDI